MSTKNSIKERKAVLFYSLILRRSLTGCDLLGNRTSVRSEIAI